MNIIISMAAGERNLIAREETDKCLLKVRHCYVQHFCFPSRSHSRHLAFPWGVCVCVCVCEREREREGLYLHCNIFNIYI